MVSYIFEQAQLMWKQMREDWQDYVAVQYDKALEDCCGVLVNKLGLSEGIQSESLFTGHLSRAKKYASEELIQWWEEHPRMTMTDYEYQWWCAHNPY